MMEQLDPKIFHETASERPDGQLLHHCTECGTEYWGGPGLGGAVAWCEFCFSNTEFAAGRHPEHPKASA